MVKEYKTVTLSLITTIALMQGCDSTSLGDTTPKLWQTAISIQEYAKSSTLLSSFCENSTKVVLDVNNTTPATTDYTIVDGKLVIDLLNTDVPDGNQVRTIPLSCFNGSNSVDGNVTVTETDIANDVNYVVTSLSLPSSIKVGQDYNATIKGTDSDGVPTVSYKVLNGNDNNTTLKSGNMTCSADANNANDSTCITSVSNLTENSSLYFEYTITPEKVGEYQQSDINGSQGFEVEAQNEAPTLNLDLSSSDNVNDLGNDNYEWETATNVVFDMSGSIDNDWNITKYIVKDVTNNNVLYDWSNSSYTYSVPGNDNSIADKNIEYSIEITDNDWAKTTKTIYINYVL